MGGREDGPLVAVVRVAIVGLGVMGRNHHRVLKGLGHDVLTVDPLGHADHDSATTVNWARVDAAIIATPVSELETFAGVMFQCDIPCLVEKPGPAYGPRDWIGYTERFNPVVRALAERIGEVRVVHTGRLGGGPRHPVSAAVDLATHDLDLLGMLGVARTPIASIGDEDDFCALLGGATVRVSHRFPVKRRRIQVIGTPTLEADLIEQRLWVDGIEVPVPKREPLIDQDEAFLRGDPSPVSPADAAETLRLALTLEEMSRECATVK